MERDSVQKAERAREMDRSWARMGGGGMCMTGGVVVYGIVYDAVPDSIPGAVPDAVPDAVPGAG